MTTLEFFGLISMDQPEGGIESFLEKTKALLEVEQREEVEQTQALLQTLSPHVCPNKY